MIQPNFDKFIDVLTQELIDTPDEQILDGEDPSNVLARGQALLAAAKARADGRAEVTQKETKE